MMSIRSRLNLLRGAVTRQLWLVVLLAVLLLPVSSGAFARGPVSVAPLAEKLIGAVVNISTTQNIKGPKGVPLPRVPKGSPFEEFFEDFFNRKGPANRARKVNSLGSGFVIDPSGIIVTNHHVIEGADEIIINFHDGTKLKVEKVLGKDKKTDLAVLKVNPKKPLIAAKFGSSAKLRVGDWVMAIGNPFGLGGTVTVGIISSKQRDINSGPYDNYLQTDAAINKGNSGGPLFNMEGEVIGVNTAIISPSGGSIGIGFAVPADVAAVVVDQLAKYGETRRGWLGVRIQTVTEDIAESMNVRAKFGAMISEVNKKGPAAAAGIKPKDIITKFDGKIVATMRALPRIVAQTPVGKTVEVELLRGGKSMTVSVKVERLSEGKKKAKVAKSKQPGANKSIAPSKLVGLTLKTLSESLRAKYKLGSRVTGVVVVKVDPKGPAARKKVKVGDVIVEAGGQPVVSVADVANAIKRMKKIRRRAVLLHIEDARGDLRFVAVPLK